MVSGGSFSHAPISSAFSIVVFALVEQIWHCGAPEPSCGVRNAEKLEIGTFESGEPFFAFATNLAFRNFNGSYRFVAWALLDLFAEHPILVSFTGVLSSRPSTENEHPGVRACWFRERNVKWARMTKWWQMRLAGALPQWNDASFYVMKSPPMRLSL